MLKIEVCEGQAGLALYVNDTRIAGPRHNGLMKTVLTGTYLAAARPAVTDANEALRNVAAHLELAQEIAARPLYNQLEIGFRHFPLSPKETMQRYAESFEIVSQDIKFALEYLAKASAALRQHVKEPSDAC